MDLKKVKSVKNGVVYENGIFRIDNCRASFPHVDKPYAKADKDGKIPELKFSLVAILNKDTHQEIKGEFVKAFKEMLAANKVNDLSSDRKCLRDGDKQDREEYFGHYVLSTREARRPTVRTAKGELVIEPDRIADMIYAGCYVNVLVRLWYQDGVRVGRGFGKRINAGLLGVQFVRDGEPFGEGRVDDSDAWDAVNDEGEAFDSDDDI